MKAWRELGRLPREVWLLSTAAFVDRTGTMVLPFLVLYLTRGLGFSAARAGLLLALFGAGLLIGAPLSGVLADRFGPLRILHLSLLGSGAFLFAYPLGRTFPALALLTLGWSLVASLFRPAALTVVSELVRPELRKPAFALQRLAVNLGMSVGPAVGGFLAAASFRWLFLVDGTTSLLASAILILVPWRAAPIGGEAPGARPSPGAGPFADRRLTLFLLALVPVAMVFFQHESALSLFVVRDLRLPESAYGLLFTLNTLLIVTLEVPLNSATARWPHRRTLALGSLLVGAGFGATAFARGFAGVAASVVVWTFGEMTLVPGMAAYVADIAPEERRGAYMGLYTMAFSLGFALGPWAGTLVYERFGAALLWGSCFAFGAISAALMARLK